jgi:hypothetical protein
MTIDRAKAFRILATSLLVLAIAVEAHHSFVKREPWNGFTIFSNNISYPLIAFWALAIWGLWSENAFAKVAMFLGIFLVLAHSIVLSAGGNLGYGLTYLFTAAAAASASGAFHAEIRRRLLEERRWENEFRTKLAS